MAEDTALARPQGAGRDERECCGADPRSGVWLGAMESAGGVFG